MLYEKLSTGSDSK